MKGADDCTALSFDSGSSGAKWYSGIDHAGVEPQRPAFAVSPCDKDDVDAGIVKHDTVVDPEIGVLGDDETTAGTVDTPSFLDSADRARAYLNSLQKESDEQRDVISDRYVRRRSDDSVNSSMFTFVDGDCTLTERLGISRRHGYADDARKY